MDNFRNHWLEIMKRVITQVTLKNEDWERLCQSLPLELRTDLELRSRLET